MYVQNLDDDLRKNIGQEENKVSFNYDHDCPFEAFITNLGKYNEGKLIGEWLKFPTTPEELQNVFERIGIGSKDEYVYSDSTAPCARSFKTTLTEDENHLHGNCTIA